MNRLQRLGTCLANRINANADIIMAAMALVGLGSTIALAIQETPTAERIIFDSRDDIEAIKHECDEKGWSKEEEQKAIREIRLRTVRDLAINYAPTAFGAFATGALIIGSNKINRTRNAALTGSLNAANLAFQEYRERMRAAIGENKETAIHDDIRRSHIEASELPPPNLITNTGNGNTLCYIELEPGDKDTGVYFWSSPEAIHAAENDTNAYGLERGSVSFEDFLYFNKLKIKSHGVRMRGWRIHNRDDFVHLREGSHIHPINGQPVLDISFWDPPYYDFERMG